MIVQRTCWIAGILLFLAQLALAQPPDAIPYRFVNATHGKFADELCFWSLDNGRTWHTIAKEPTVACPKGNGRVYFALGKLPKNFDDREAYWDFIEYAFDKGTWHGNTTQVDAFCIPITIELGDKKVGINESRKKLFEAFRKDAPKEFHPCLKSDYWILSPCRAGFDKEGTNGKYFDKYIDDVWGHYSIEKKTPSGKWIGKVTNGALTFTPLDGGKPIKCERKPTTQEAFLGSGILAKNALFCAAINRHVLADPADWNNPDAFYQAEPCNWYAWFFHKHGIDKKAYGFCYDDVSEQAAFFSGKGKEVVVTLRWDE
ncbi:MAG TPA: beta-1,3-glucanase family protein [Gemmataceae bacterium]|nr:beta-1,3-glucanase family protein [Gemmataceae bacterium]